MGTFRFWAVYECVAQSCIVTEQTSKLRIMSNIKLMRPSNGPILKWLVQIMSQKPHTSEILIRKSHFLECFGNRVVRQFRSGAGFPCSLVYCLSQWQFLLSIAAAPLPDLFAF